MSISEYDRTHIGEIVAGEGTWFTAILLRLIAHADGYNRERLRLAFPHEVAAFEAWKRSPNGVVQ